MAAVHLQLPCYSGTEWFGCPSHELPAKYLAINNESQARNYIRRSNCPSTNIKLLIVVNSRRKNVEVREWLRLYYETIEHVRVRFVVGKAIVGEAESIGRAIEKELSSNDDIILGNFEDIYANLDRKTLVRFQFVAGRTCSTKLERT